MKTPIKDRRVKAWVVIDLKFMRGGIENADYFANNECPAANDSEAMAIYSSRKLARLMAGSPVGRHRIVPCTITYTLPVKKSAAEEFFTCRCPAGEKNGENGLVHRVPIDCRPLPSKRKNSKKKVGKK